MTTPRPWSEGQRPEHDPVAEDMDLLTHQEAAARFFDEIERLRAEEAWLLTSSGADDRLGGLRQRIADLEEAIERVAAKRTPDF